MTILLRTHKMLWGRAAQRCAFPECRRCLVEDRTLTDDESLVGEACHIASESNSFPRADFSMSIEQRNKYENLILLCRVHHKLIDDQYREYTVERLHQLKDEHELWVSTNLAPAKPFTEDEHEICASYVDEWAQRADLAEWKNWTSGLLSTDPHISKERLKQLSDLRDWIQARVWTQACNPVKKSLRNFRIVLNDLLLVFLENAQAFGDEELITERFYRIRDFDPQRYHMLVRRYERHVDLLHDLVLELTRAANYVCETVRQELSPSYRLSDGVLLVTRGFVGALQFEILRVEYQEAEKLDRPYPGLKNFETTRFQRDHWIGESI